MSHTTSTPHVTSHHGRSIPTSHILLLALTPSRPFPHSTMRGLSCSWLPLAVLLSTVLIASLPSTCAYYWSIYSDGNCTSDSLLSSYSFSSPSNLDHEAVCDQLDTDGNSTINFSCDYSNTLLSWRGLAITYYQGAPSTVGYLDCYNRTVLYGVAMEGTQDTCVRAIVAGGTAGPGGALWGQFSCSASSGASGLFNGMGVVQSVITGLGMSWLAMLLSVV